MRNHTLLTALAAAGLTACAAALLCLWARRARR